MDVHCAIFLFKKIFRCHVVSQHSSSLCDGSKSESMIYEIAMTKVCWSVFQAPALVIQDGLCSSAQTGRKSLCFCIYFRIVGWFMGLMTSCVTRANGTLLTNRCGGKLELEQGLASVLQSHFWVIQKF